MKMITDALSPDHFLIITDPPQDPYSVMERDSELLKLYGTAEHTTVRFYQWKSPAITLGRLQSPNAVDQIRAQKSGIAVTVRPTGGRHVFHADDFCFSIIIPPKELPLWGRSVPERQRSIGSLISSLLVMLGVDAQSSSETVSPHAVRLAGHSPCFSLTAEHEPVFGRLKTAGTAQLVTDQGILVQGSIPVTERYLEIAEYEPGPPELRSKRRHQLMQTSTSLQRVRPDAVFDFQQITACFTEVLRTFYRENSFCAGFIRE